jgi:hypothetical protein
VFSGVFINTNEVPCVLWASMVHEGSPIVKTAPGGAFLVRNVDVENYCSFGAGARVRESVQIFAPHKNRDTCMHAQPQKIILFCVHSDGWSHRDNGSTIK